MKRISFLLFLFVAHSVARCQPEDDGVKLDLLKAPSSPASNLLNIAASDVDKPTDVSAFMLSLRQATANFTMVPLTYAVDLAPYWLFKIKKGDISSTGLKRSFGSDVIAQTLVLSLAIRNTDSTETELAPSSTYTGLGFKFSIFRGEYDKSTNDALDEIKKWQDIKLDILKKELASYMNDPGVLDLQQKRKDLFKIALNDAVDSALLTNEFRNATAQQIEALKNQLLPQISEKVRNSPEFSAIGKALELKLQKLKKDEMTEANEKIRQIASSFQTARIGFTWDIAGGLSLQFINKRFNDSRVNNTGVWSVLGYTSKKIGSGLLLLRLLYNPDKIFAKDNAANDIGNIVTFDFGGRYVYSTPQSKFNASLEGVYRSVLSSNTINPSWRIIFNADYAIWPNQKLTFSFGRNFDGTITKDGNLVAALGFLSGFGNKR